VKGKEKREVRGWKGERKMGGKGRKSDDTARQ